MPGFINVLSRILVASCLLAGISSSMAADLKDAKDDPLVGRFRDSGIVMYQKKTFDAFTLAVSPMTYNYTSKKYEMAKKLDLTGEVTKLAYLAPMGNSALEIAESYKQALKAKGFAIVYEAAGDDIGKDAAGWFAETTKDVGQLFEYSNDKGRYLVGELDKDGVKTDVALYATEYQMGASNVKAAPGQGIYSLSVIRSGTLQANQVVVSAADIQTGLAAQGHIAIYSVYFDTGKADLKPESRPALDQVAAFLQASPDLKVFVVGHTDNVGTPDFNQKLSLARAASTVAALEQLYGFAPARLSPAGAGPYAPVAANTTEDGRARNRRVEIVPQ